MHDRRLRCDACVFTAQGGAPGAGCQLDAAAGQVTGQVARKLSRVVIRARNVAQNAAELLRARKQALDAITR